ncbi:hypothetical protein [Actinoplanes sp. NPDC049265]|uniref:hypothetical protein n=1 Tax=Actinoplanes sp. NPDC049265 TaxID=3363902 RepID=UPI0037249657
MTEPERRRRRVRTSHTPEPVEEQPAEPVAERPKRAGEDAERGLRGLVGSGSSQVSVGAAMRARDAARPTDEHYAEAAKLPVVRRNWTPREELPRNR